MTANWLEDYLSDAVRRKLCTRIGCTTCGAFEFREGVLKAMSAATGLAERRRFDQEASLEVARELAHLARPSDPDHAFEAALRCLLVDLSSGLPFLDREIKEALAGSWAASIQQEMVAAHEARASARRARDEYLSSENVHRRREERLRQIQTQHTVRMAAKVARDRLWRQQFAMPIDEIERQYRGTSAEIVIRSSDYWFKVVEFLQQNWALVDASGGQAAIWFFGDTSGVFDKMFFQSMADAQEGLRRNGFARFTKNPGARRFIALPLRPFRFQPHPNGPIYSSGRNWK